MPFFPQLSIVFIHIPKTGGTSIEHYYFSQLDINFQENNFKKEYHPYYWGIDKKLFDHSLQHCTFLELKQRLPLDRVDCIFTIVRNPFHRLVSEFLFQKTNEGDLESIQRGFLLFIKSILSGTFKKDNHHLRQYEFLVNEKGEIDKSIDIYKFENLAEDFSEIQWLQRNKSLFAYEDYYTEESKALALSYYAKDFELFGYSKELTV